MGRNKDLSVFSPNPVAPIWSAVFCAPRGDMPCPSVPIGLRSTTRLQTVHTKQISEFWKSTPQTYMDSPSFPNNGPMKTNYKTTRWGTAFI